MRLCVCFHSAHSLGSALSSYLLDNGLKNGQALSPVGKCQRIPVLVSVKILYFLFLEELAAADKNRLHSLLGFVPVISILRTEYRSARD